ncbi:dienelactone hydrolase family protein [Prauserella muralis]|uniref:Carboxymethylenebutenolidase n=1 Tax=Prauserella muralis TaxID=588067 RepID=A0A2V4B6R9_9PSEU|nr:dienelactone hydrolase family protein [Prauserella muralis]PXY31085.1 carboxymethylenebutenolidase [Prauserella muralis]TWE14634.1 carboxymethylenebutenolidase [Prauserella muralis]
MVTTRYVHLAADGGGGFDAFCAVPDAGRGPGVLLLQEVFGINDNMRSLAERLAGHGYVVLVPDMFWRLRRRFESKDESGLAEGMELAQQLDLDAACADMAATLRSMREMSECTGLVGGIGFCLGGTLAYLLATSVRADGRGPDAVVSYYGSGVHAMLDRVGSIECPMMFHYGDADPYISAEAVAAVEAAVANRPDITVHHYDAGHAFSNFDAPSFFQREAADLAWGRTLAFLDDHLKTR